MNHLAHFFLARQPPCLIPGALLADQVRGRLRGEFSPCLERGVMLHRRIDAFTDQHPMPRRSAGRLPAGLRRYRAPVVDVLYDHVLAVSWSSWSAESMGAFSELVFDRLEAAADQMPWPLSQVPGRMRSHDTLRRYADPGFVQFALDRLAERFSHAASMREAWLVFEEQRPAFQQDFEAFFPELIRHAAGLVAATAGVETKEYTCPDCRPPEASS